MTGKLEEVARAISRDNGDLDGYTGGTPLDGFDYESAAKAAIKAMRTPTREMCEQGGIAYVKFRVGRITPAQRKKRPPWASFSEMQEVWQAMIDAVLEGKS